MTDRESFLLNIGKLQGLSGYLKDSELREEFDKSLRKVLDIYLKEEEIIDQ